MTEPQAQAKIGTRVILLKALNQAQSSTLGDPAVLAVENQGAAPQAEKSQRLLDGPARYKLVQARTILNKVKGGMPMQWTINPYRGCRHACVYCFARPTHLYYGLNPGADFHTQIFVKINAPQLLRVELARPRWQGEPICLGSVTDPYQPAETRYRVSRGLLKVLCDFANPLDIITKSPLILQDLELLTELNRRTSGQVTVNMSLITLNEAKARMLDPGAPSPRKRLATLAKLSAAGIKTRLFIMPIVPGLTDDPQELEELVAAAAQAGVSSVAGDTLKIEPGLAEYFYNFIDHNFPQLRPRYDRIYNYGRRTYAAPRYREAARAKIAALRAQYHLEDRPQPALERDYKQDYKDLERVEHLPATLKKTEKGISAPNGSCFQQLEFKLDPN